MRLVANETEKAEAIKQLCCQELRLPNLHEQRTGLFRGSEL